MWRFSSRRLLISYIACRSSTSTRLKQGLVLQAWSENPSKKVTRWIPQLETAISYSKPLKKKHHLSKLQQKTASASRIRTISGKSYVLFARNQYGEIKASLLNIALVLIYQKLQDISHSRPLNKRTIHPKKLWKIPSASRIGTIFGRFVVLSPKLNSRSIASAYHTSSDLAKIAKRSNPYDEKIWRWWEEKSW